MKTKYKFIHMVKVAEKPKTSIWSCRNNRSGEELGTIKWYGPWRQYCFFPLPNCIFNNGCLEDIKKKISELMAQRRMTEKNE